MSQYRGGRTPTTSARADLLAEFDVSGSYFQDRSMNPLRGYGSANASLTSFSTDATSSTPARGKKTYSISGAAATPRPAETEIASKAKNSNHSIQ